MNLFEILLEGIAWHVLKRGMKHEKHASLSNQLERRFNIFLKVSFVWDEIANANDSDNLDLRLSSITANSVHSICCASLRLLGSRQLCVLRPSRRDCYDEICQRNWQAMQAENGLDTSLCFQGKDGQDVL